MSIISEVVKMTKFTEILRLREQGLSQRQIAASLRISRNTIKDFLSRLEASELTLPLSEAFTDQDLWRMLYVDKRECQSYRTPDYEWMDQELKHKGVTLISLWGAYRISCNERGEQAYGYTQFCKLYSDHLKSNSRTMSIPRNPGENTEVDWAGSTLSLQDPLTGDAIPVYLFVATLSFSGYSYFEGFLNRSAPNWIAANVHCVEFFEGATAIFTPDNLRTGVIEPDWYEPGLHQAYLEFAEHYRTAILPARVRKPKDKPNVENHVKIATSWIIAELRHRTFFSLDDLNTAIWERMDDFNSRQFQKKPGSRQSMYMEIERQHLSPLPPISFEYSERKEATVAPDFHLSYDYCLYSVPYKLVGKKLLVRATSTKVMIFDHGEQVAAHKRGIHKGQRMTDPEHLPESYREYASWSGDSFRYRARSIGAKTFEVIDFALRSREFEVQAFRQCVGILNLAKKHSPEMLELACEAALQDRRTSYKYIKNLMDSMALEPGEPMEEEEDRDNPSPFARPKGFYSALPVKKEVQG
jgi:transposase